MAEVAVTVLLTVSGCPMKDTIDRDVRRALGEVEGVTASKSPSVR
jgi:ATP-binding protein involved in chromosome partitioning